MDLSNSLLYSQWSNRERYDIHRYYVPASLSKRLRFVKKYFRLLDRFEIPQKYKRRKSPTEYLETAVMILSRIEQLWKMDVPIIVGSGYISEISWATFGRIPDVESRFNFGNFNDLADHYYNGLVNGGVYSREFPFRVCPNLPWELASKYQSTPHFIISIALCLLSDILTKSGPDCPDLYDLFTNDTRVSAKGVDVEAWKRIRYKMMGKRGKIYEDRFPIALGQYYQPPISLTSSTKFEELPNSDDIEVGERVIIIKKSTPTTLVEYLGGQMDELVEDPATDSEYKLRVFEALRRNSHLGIDGASSCCQ